MPRTATDDEIAEAIILYIKDPARSLGAPTRDGAIRFITGELTTLPSSVARVFKSMMDSGKIAPANNGMIKLGA